MPFALITIGLIVFIAGVKDTQTALAAQIQKDFTGANNFFYWIAAIIIIGSVGYVPRFQSISRAFLLLVILAMVLANQGFFAQLQAALSSTATAQPSAAGTDASTPTGIAAAANAQSGTSTGTLVDQIGAAAGLPALLTDPVNEQFFSNSGAGGQAAGSALSALGGLF